MVQARSHAVACAAHALETDRLSVSVEAGRQCVGGSSLSPLWVLGPEPRLSALVGSKESTC